MRNPRKQPFSLLLIIAVTLISCDTEPHNVHIEDTVDYRQEMRNFIIRISDYAKNADSDFLVIPQNGQELITENDQATGTPVSAYLQAIDATGRENLFYGYKKDDKKTPAEEQQQLLDLCLLFEHFQIEVLTTDYCYTHSKIERSYQENERYNFISFAASDRELRTIPDYPAKPHHENSEDINSLSQTQNFLYLINSEKFPSKIDFLNAIIATNYDLVIIDLFHDEQVFNSAEIQSLKMKQNGHKRLVICYMNIGQAEDYRYYWQAQWKTNIPLWLVDEDSKWKGNYFVKYWDKEWQHIIFGSKDAYLDRIIDAGCDGVYLDSVDAFAFFEENLERR
jgi:cysteinyl-tRNA synthetase